MAENINLVSYLRKGLSKYIKDGQATNGSRATIDFMVEMEGNKVEDGSSLPKQFSTGRTLSLVGPADVKQVKTDIISHHYPPATNTQRFNPTFMPYIEFYEGDFPWRYTPLPASQDEKQCTPWLVLVAATDEECKIVTKRGKKKVVFNLSNERYDKVFPSAALHNKLAHVQLAQKGDEDGVSRLLCGSELPQGQHVTVFLLPAFETGRLSGLNEKDDEGYDGVPISKLSWEDHPDEFPVYYHWSYYTDIQSGSFETLANKLDMAPNEVYNTLKANLTVDIAQSGLADDGLEEKLDDNGEYVIDVPAALNLALGNQKDAALREEPNKYKESLKEELELNPVFIENTTGEPVKDQDPWVVPPVYGARHLLSENLEGNNVVTETNLNLKHRIAAGMGASVVKENQESFVHRAWQKVEKINELNQALREYFQMQEVEQKAQKRLANQTSIISNIQRDQKMSESRFKLITSDALPRSLSASKIAHNRISVNDVRELMGDKNKCKPVGKDERIIGITPDELGTLFKAETWQNIIDSDEFNKSIANQMIEPYLRQHNWMQYFINPAYNSGTKPQTIKAIEPKVYHPQQNHYLVTEECTELFCWMWGWTSQLVADDAHTFDYYFSAALNGCLQSGIFQSSYYNADDSTPIDRAVYPVKLWVTVNKKDYNGYIMDAALFKEKFGDKPFIAFEYNKTKNNSVTSEKDYVFLIPSDHEKLTYRKNIHFEINGETTHYFKDFKYVNGEYKSVDTPYGSAGPFAFIDTTSKPFSANEFYKSVLNILEVASRMFGFPSIVKYDPAYPNMAYIEVKHNNNTRRIYFKADGSKGISLKGTKTVVNMKKLREAICDFRALLVWLDEQWLSRPDVAYIDLSSFNENRMSVDDYGLNIQSSDKWQLYTQLKELLETKNFQIKGITPEPEIEEPPVSIPDLDKEKEDTIETLIQEYGYTEDAQLEEQIRERGLTKYPVMIYPDYLDPTLFYLRELSENYVIPSAGELTNNSVTIFQNNTAFEEAFLMGMNTEMGQELLWREYPTDQRGSYFRKFWVSSNLPKKDKLETEYFDIKKVHKWDKPLGHNHTKDNAQMLVFAIKGELMQAYPKTTICLSKYENQTLYIMAQASMTTWLSEDTYLVGFEGISVQDVTDLFLTFQEDVTGLQFEYETFQKEGGKYDDSASLAYQLMNKPSVFLLPINNN